SSGAQRSGWSVFEYGDRTNTGGSMSIRGDLLHRAIWRFQSVSNSGDYSTPGMSANFDVHRSYEWPIIRPRSAADAAHPDDSTPINTVARIGIFDTATSTEVLLNDANLNA